MATIQKVTAAHHRLSILDSAIKVARLKGQLVTQQMLDLRETAQVEGVVALTAYVAGTNFTQVTERQATSIERLAAALGFEVSEVTSSGQYPITDITTGVGTLRVTRSVVSRTQTGRPVYAAQAVLRVMHDEQGAELDVSFDVQEVADVVEPEVVYDYDPTWSQECPGVAA